MGRLSEDAGRRIAKTVLAHERSARNAGSTRGRWDGAAPMEQWFQLTENLVPGGDANSNPVEFTKTSGYVVDNSTTVLLYDLQEQCWGLKGERVRALPHGDDTAGVKWVVTSTGAPWYKMGLSEILSQGNSADATITIRSTAVTVKVEDAFLGSGQTLAANAVIGVSPDVNGKRFVVTEAAC